MKALRLTFLALLSVLWLVPSPTLAGHDGTCHPSGPSGGAGKANFQDISLTKHVDIDIGLSLLARVHADGSADVRGNIRVSDDGARGVDTVLIATSSDAQASCADIDEDGIDGLVSLETTFQDVPTGTRVPVGISTGGQEIDAPGTYPLTLRIGNTSYTVEVQARLTPGRDAAPVPRAQNERPRLASR